MTKHIAVFISLLFISSISCSVRKAQIVVQTSLTSIAIGVEAASRASAEQLDDAPSLARQQALDTRRENPEMTLDEAMELYRQALNEWYALSAALTDAHRYLLLGQSALDVWVSSGNLPDSWSEFCDGIRAVLESVVLLLEDLQIDLPDLLQQSIPYADIMCEVADSFLVQRE